MWLSFFDGERYNDWRVAVGAPDSQLKFTDCVEFEVPLFLGGSATLDNLKLIDLGVAWTLGSQLISQSNVSN